MQLPPSFENSYGKGNVCKLKRSLYNLKQSPRAWFDSFSKSIKVFSFSQSSANHTLFLMHSMNGKITILIVYVYDIILIKNDEAEIGQLKTLLSKEFEIRGMGPLQYFLEIEIA